MTHSRTPVALVPESPTLKERLLAGVTFTASGCWEWNGSRDRSGYGWINNAGRIVKAHRASYAVHVRPVAAGETICHHCDNPPCINPEHLFVGTTADNVADMIAKGRRRPNKGYVKGETHPRSKMTDADVTRLRAMRVQGAKYADLMAEFGLSKSMVGDICTGKRWRHPL